MRARLRYQPARHNGNQYCLPEEAQAIERLVKEILDAGDPQQLDQPIQGSHPDGFLREHKIDLSGRKSSGSTWHRLKTPLFSPSTKSRLTSAGSRPQKGQPRNGAGEIFMPATAEIARETVSAANRFGTRDQ
jgi:hypothetical protein